MAAAISRHTVLLGQQIRRQFSSLFPGEPLMVRSPGRINLIGEHTDYNEGFVLPAAVDRGIVLALLPRTDQRILLHAAGPGESYEARTDSLHPLSEPHWPNYILGVVHQLAERGYSSGGFNLVFDGDVPMGAGMSSSAALECAAIYALNEAHGWGIPKLELARMAQQAEHTFAGVLSGIMDQFASLFGRKGQFLKLDCRSLEYEYIPSHLEGYQLVLLNSNVKHSLAGSAYNERRRECEEGVRLLQQQYPEVQSLRDASPEMLEAAVKPYEKRIWQRCRYVVDENARLLEAVAALRRGDLQALGALLFRSHEGLQTQYEVSCPETDFLVNAMRGMPEVPGARMMGGGFGGCTINLVREDAVESMIATVSAAYQSAFGLELSPYIVQTENGTSVLPLS